jgi:hypothetical protein
MDLTDAVHRHGLPAVLSMQEDVEKARWCPRMTLLVAQFDQWHGQGEPLVALDSRLGEPLVALEDDTADETYVMMEFENVGLY